MTISFRDYLDIEAALHKKLTDAWKKQYRALAGDLFVHLKEDDFSSAAELVASIDMTPIYVENKLWIKYLLKASMNFGAAMAANGSDKTGVSTGDFDETLDPIIKVFGLALTHNATKFVRDAALQSIAVARDAALDEGRVVKAEDFLKDFVSFEDQGDKMLQLISSLHTNRLATWGFTSEAQLRGVTTYKITAVLDGRTSAFCTMINGKTFDVEDAHRTVLEVLSLPSPDDAKTVQPWPKQTKDAIADFEKQTTVDLVRQNLHIPPYHPGCRTILTTVERSPALRKPPVSPDVALPPYVSTIEDFVSLGNKLSPEQLTQWNDYLGVDPAGLLSKLTQVSGAKILEGALGKAKKISVSNRGDFKIKAKWEIGDGVADMSLLFDPFTGTVAKNYLDLTNLTRQRATQFIRQFYSDLVDTSLSIGATNLTVAVTPSTAISAAKKGFVLTAPTWAAIRLQMQDRIAEGGALYDSFRSLPNEARAVVSAALSNNDPYAFNALSDMPHKLGGKRLASALLGDSAFDMVLDLSDEVAVKKAKS